MIQRKTDKAYWEKGFSSLFKKLPITINEKDKTLKDLFKLFKKVLPKNKSFIEIGSSIASWPYYFYKNFNYEISGVEFTEKGCDLARMNLDKLKVKKFNIIKADFFDKTFLRKYNKKFDVVFSAGFIEHFNEPKAVVDKKTTLIKKGGYLITIIPNLKGIYYPLQKILKKSVLAKHNLNIMNLKKFSELFDKKQMQQIYCDYIGSFNFGLINSDKWILKLLYLSQLFLFSHLKIKGPKSSPYLLYIGVKK